MLSLRFRPELTHLHSGAVKSGQREALAGMEERAAAKGARLLARPETPVPATTVKVSIVADVYRH